MTHVHAIQILGPILVGILFICASSLFRELNRQHFMAIMFAGAGAAYLNGGLGEWEFAFATVATYFAYMGLRSYNFIGVGWLLHTG